MGQKFHSVCKPGSVQSYLCDDHLSRPIVAYWLKPLVGTHRANVLFLSALHRIGFTDGVRLRPRGELLPRLSTLTEKSAVYLCCTIPEVTLGGR